MPEIETWRGIEIFTFRVDNGDVGCKMKDKDTGVVLLGDFHGPDAKALSDYISAWKREVDRLRLRHPFKWRRMLIWGDCADAFDRLWYKHRIAAEKTRRLPK